MPAGNLAPRPLGPSGIAVSALSLGSWRTFERLPPETGVAIMRAARDEGITFFDDARDNDEMGTAPIPTGYSEVLSAAAAGRLTGTHTEPRFAPAIAAAGELAGLAESLHTTAATLALAFPFTNPDVASVLFGTTSTEQLRANCAAAALWDRLGPDDIAALLRIGRLAGAGPG